MYNIINYEINYKFHFQIYHAFVLRRYPGVYQLTNDTKK